MSRRTYPEGAVLAWLRLRLAGVSTVEIAARWRVAPEAVRIATNRVRDADIAESGEKPAKVAEYYPIGGAVAKEAAGIPPKPRRPPKKPRTRPSRSFQPWDSRAGVHGDPDAIFWGL